MRRYLFSLYLRRVEALRLYWVVGELSGEQHAEAVIAALREIEPATRMRGMGGERMAALGMELLAHWQRYAVVGFMEVLRNLPRFIRLYRQLQRDILAYRPHRLILVDYPGLNLRLARWAARQGIPVTYFILPQLWAWNPGRVRYLQHPDMQLLCILPFEPDFYARYGIRAEYVGHPLVEQLRGIEPMEWARPYIALLPGSRYHEVKNMLPVMAQIRRHFPEMDFIVSKVPHLPEALYRRYTPDLLLMEGQTRSLLRGATAAVVTSGTATLEAALLGVPSVILYRGNPISYHIAKRLVRVSFIGLPNLILDEPVFPELIQRDCTVENVAAALTHQLTHRVAIQQKLTRLHELLGDRPAARTAAQAILTSIRQTA